MRPLDDLKSRLFRKYAALLVFLVIGVLLVSAGIELFVGYQDRRSSLAEIQRERAASAALSIERFIDGIVWQVEGVANNPQPTGIAGIERRRLNYLSLLKHVPALTDISYIDNTGEEQVRVSRIALDVVGSNTSHLRHLDIPASGSDEEVYFSPVYFRNESEPFMTVAVTEQGRDSGVVTAEVNLKFIWEVISQIEIGETGYAYAIDANGILVAHPNISLVLKMTDLSDYKQIRSALETPAGQAYPHPAEVMIARDMDSNRVLATHHPIGPMGWYVIVEQPLGEAFGPLYGAFWRTGFLLVVGVGMAVVASLILARKMVTPIRALQASAARIGAGELDQRIDLDTDDELEDLAEGINQMASRLRESYANLEHKIEVRTKDLVSTQQLLTMVEEAKEEERKNLAAELHDQTLADLGGLAVELGFLADQASVYSEDLKLSVDEVRERLTNSDRALREIVQGIFPPVLTIMGLIPAVNSFLSDISGRSVPSPHNIEVLLVATGFNNGRLEESLEISLYRVIQQGLVNVIQHAQAKHVNIDLRWQDEKVTLVLADDGIGFDVPDPTQSPVIMHYGLTNLKSRIEKFSGHFEIESQPGVGTTLRATIPVVGTKSESDELRTSTHILQKQPTPRPVT